LAAVSGLRWERRCGSGGTRRRMRGAPKG
jgi:hypothetical protein